jgi:hypothetical protein
VTRLALALAIAIGGCSDPVQVGAMRVHPTPAGAELFVDAVSRGPATEGQIVELSAGMHVAELRRDGRVLVTLPVEIRAALIFDARITAPEEPEEDTGVGAPPEPIEAEPIEAEPELAPPVSPSRTPEAIGRVVAGGRGRLQRCYERALREGPMPDVRVNVTLQIMASGEVADVTLDTTAPATLQTCLRRGVQDLAFGPGDVSSVSFPIVFSAD